jgi:putative hydrolase of the HAD superfamily
LRLIAWDFDGVLNRGYQGGFDEWQRTFEADLGVSAQVFTACIYTDANFLQVLTGQRDILDVLQDWITAHAVPHQARDVLDYWLDKDAVADAQVVGWLEACAVPGVIATNNETHRADHIWHRMGFSRHMARMFASGRMGVKKPDGGFFAQIEDWSGHAPGDILLIDDSEKNIVAAAARGWQVFHFTDQTRAVLPAVLGLT